MYPPRHTTSAKVGLNLTSQSYTYHFHYIRSVKHSRRKDPVPYGNTYNASRERFTGSGESSVGVNIQVRKNEKMMGSTK
jgi:hypothetical protein